MEGFGFKIVIFPASALLTAAQAIRQTLSTLKQQGTTAHLVENMTSLQDCFEAVGLSEMLADDARFRHARTGSRRLARQSAIPAMPSPTETVWRGLHVSNRDLSGHGKPTEHGTALKGLG